ncbi:MAG: thiolase domain-containing protein [Thermofilum sp.]|jgi:acetyl-CoA C-acetyltransferase|uniref:thiolase domain-containing protein n=1 Tax=Thermofilum sp. TaxID=1961369 RepID=UPI00258BDD2C|nr:thiolase domain-containing protein [Thermofilum sp.]MCI4407922.1 thiolase domain-containing protein [Thermofilum sp.]
MSKVYVAGIGATKIDEHWEKGIRDLMVEAALNAIKDAGIEKKEIEAIFVGNMSSGYLQGQEHLGSLLATWLGIPGVAANKVEAACASGGAAVHNAFLAVKSGVYDCVLVVGVEKLTDAITSDATDALIMAEDQEYVAFTGASFVALNAFVYRAYMKKYQAKQEDIALFAVHDHKYAANNPLAQYQKPITLEEVLKSPMVADPVRLLESAPLGDGSAALVLCSEKKLKELQNRDVLVELAGSSVSTEIFSVHDRTDLTSIGATVKASRKAFQMAGVEPKNVNVVEVHDAFTVLGVIHLEDLGFAERGSGWKLLKEGQLEKDGKIPTNTMGGLKARGHPVGATGVYQVYDVVTQLRGEAGKNQVDGAEVGLAQNVGGVGGTVAVNILKRVR